MEHTRRPRVTVISLGGTIASTPLADSTSGVTPRLSASDLVASVPQLGEVADVTALAFRQVPSGDLTLDDVVALAREIEMCYDTGADGVVVTQGTDTIEETSFALDLLVANSRGLVVTGAMRHPTQLSADGPSNLLSSVRVASSPHARDLGTLVVLNDEIHAARFVRKTHTSRVSAFQSPGCGPLGWIVEGRVRVVVRVAALARVTPVIESVPPVALVTCSLGDDDRMVTALGSLGYAGAVVAGFGAGHVPARVVAALDALARRVPVVLASRTGAGELLRETYGFRGSESDLAARGLWSAGSLDGVKARVLLSLVLAGGGDAATVRANFERVAASLHARSTPTA